MRKPEYLSPTSINLFFDNRQLFYLQYLSEVRPSRPPQTMAMAIGSAFDAYVKSYLVEKLYGNPELYDKSFVFETLFQKQVEPQCRDDALKAGKYIFDFYLKSNALNDLLLDLKHADDKVSFEFEIKQSFSHARLLNTVPLLGKPDVYFKTKNGKIVILDFKVNNFLGYYNLSPKPGYIRIREGLNFYPPAYHSSRSKDGAAHKDAVIMLWDGLQYNCAMDLESIDESWARQLTIYAWILGESFDCDFLVGIDQIVGNGKAISFDSYQNYPQLRVASFRMKVGQEFKTRLIEQIIECWNLIQSGHIFNDRSFEESLAYCEKLDKLLTSEDPKEKFLLECTLG